MASRPYEQPLLEHEHLEDTSPSTMRIAGHPDYKDDVFYVCQPGTQNDLSKDGQWTTDISEALHVQLNPGDDQVTHTSDTTTTITAINNNCNATARPLTPPTSSLEQVFISADGIDLYQPDTSFVLYAINSGFRNSGDAQNFGGELAFRGGRTTMELDSSCLPRPESVRTKGDTWFEEPADHDDWALMPVPRGLPSMFVLWNGNWYYAISYLKASFADGAGEDD
ncbi:hypothetical protein BO86DRAFT_401196 [Aspergillus japonicus CBS 114.51]|uniref:Uncharacterized protein n=1 Tax=Aspergillus japonicus CBS 114.51 TaxID=1448312 RepID=A0A8T8WWL7_ASPJA|nr:hypothetical protein BO86DRAFT_401196 [Aspergillus japonicus CBS 114.51]RAH80203.1 hypothetical protein BO86DRAFT_401196 [Aspergillus japonicus CBS 114.51]